VNIHTLGGETPLEEILAHTELILRPGEFVLVGLEPAERTRLESDLASIKSDFCQYIIEPDVLTLLLDSNDWTHLSRHYPQANVEGPLRIFTFSVAMDWQVVGFLATVTTLLAQAGISLGAVCGYYRDHLFISIEHAARAEEVLRTEIERLRQLD
jgi:hypothetical protein